MQKRFLFHYYMGARGDFLGAVLTNHFHFLDKSNYSVPPIGNEVVKVHGINYIVSLIQKFPNKFNSFEEMFQKANDLKLTKIKIVANTFEEKLDVVYFGWAKNISHGRKVLMSNVTLDEVKTSDFTDKLKLQIPWIMPTIHKDIDIIQDEDKDYINEYDYIVSFNDLFDIEFLKDLYLKIHQEPMPFFVIDNVVQNIEIQDRPSKSKNYAIFKEIYQEYLKIQELTAALE